MRRRKKKNWKLKDLLVKVGILVFLAGLVYFLLERYKEQQEVFVRFEAFGIDLPVAYDIHGIDVSRYQQNINWKLVKEMEVQGKRIGFAFIKATEGETLIDPTFKRNFRLAKSNGIPRGAYHYFIPSLDANQQARQFISNVRLVTGDLPPVLDVEQTNQVPLIVLKAKVRAWLELIEGYYGVRPIIYTHADFYQKYLGKDFDEYPLWVAHYYEKHKPRISRPWLFWQHNDKGNVDGIKGSVDFNVFNGDSTAFRNLLMK